jgi:CheY-like chemotaxis protein
MTTSITVLPPVVGALPNPLKKKKVLLVDGSPKQRDLRADTMRKLGIDVDIAADISEARSWWRADLYNLVLIDVENELGHRDKFCEDIRRAIPPQQLAFLVGKPGYLADMPNLEGVAVVHIDNDRVLPDDAKATLTSDVPRALQQRWGILEASRRISAVRSISHARSKAIQARPAPARDSDVRPSRPGTVSRTLDELLREEMQ